MTSAEFRIKGKDEALFMGTYGAWNDKEVNMIAKYPTVGDFLDSPENTWDRYQEVFFTGNLPPIYVLVGEADRCRCTKNWRARLAIARHVLNMCRDSIMNMYFGIWQFRKQWIFLD